MQELVTMSYLIIHCDDNLRGLKLTGRVVVVRTTTAGRQRSLPPQHRTQMVANKKDATISIKLVQVQKVNKVK